MADSRTALTRRRSSWLCFSGCSTAFSSRFLHQSIRNTSSSPRVPKSTIQPGELSTTPHTSISLSPSPLVINKSGLSGCPSGTHYPFPCGVSSPFPLSPEGLQPYPHLRFISSFAPSMHSLSNLLLSQFDVFCDRTPLCRSCGC